ncbi:hypothetical protein JCM16161A_14410 [Vulcanisaeta sp. JCM 16161]|uniref:hypothetical protein n=1 Tax=Vulcanisaeta sp. JCM 16161 TaxID=1295372 RepID=UPI000AC8C728|nr:hypothetical protein [Vulcanisaeta sp. JCM 16161]
MALNGLRICWGRKVKGLRRLECGEEVKDPRIIEEVMKLINEFIDRVEKRRGVLLSESATPFDNATNALNDWLRNIETRIGESNDEGIANLRRAMLNAGKRMLELLNQACEKWLKAYKPELEELIKKIQSGETKVIISGKPFDKSKSFTVRLYTEDLAIELVRVAKSGSITM